MGFGSFLSDAVKTATDTGKAALQQVGAAAASGADKAAELAARARQLAVDAAVAAKDQAVATAVAAKNQAVATARYARDQAVAAKDAVVGGATYAARKAGAVGLLGTEAVAATGVGVAGAGAVVAGKAYGKVAQTYKDVKEAFSPSVPVAYPCIPCLAKDSAEARKARIARRQALIDDSLQSKDPKVKAAARELAADMRAVELARLSDNTYAQYDPNKAGDARKPPEPWTAVTNPDDLEAMGLSPDDVKAAKAVVYQVPSDFPFNPKTVVAFRGTTGEGADIIADHDQALGLEHSQYKAAIELGKQMKDNDIDAVVTGHSLGGGKAQAAGVAGDLPGQMFNSAGLHPKTMGYASTAQLAPYADNFVQYRAAGGVAQGGGDPLTGTQNSPTAQKAALGLVTGLEKLGKANQWALNELGVGDPLGALPAQHQQLARDMANRLLNVTRKEAEANLRFSQGQWYIPPAVGEVRGLTSKALDGQNAGVADQHSIVTLVNGFEHRKSDDLQTMLDAAGKSDEKADYIGKMDSRTP